MKKAVVAFCLVFISCTLLARQKNDLDYIKALTDAIEPTEGFTLTLAGS